MKYQQVENSSFVEIDSTSSSGYGLDTELSVIETRSCEGSINLGINFQYLKHTGDLNNEDSKFHSRWLISLGGTFGN